MKIVKNNALSFDDLLGNISILEKDIVKAYSIPTTAAVDFYVNLMSTKEPNEVAKLAIVMNVVIANIIIFRDTATSQNFLIEWTSHPINKLVNTWLNNIDTQKERTRHRFNQIRQELLEVTWASNRLHNIDGI